MATIGKLQVDLRLQTAKFSQGVKKTTGQLRRMEKAALSMRGAMVGLVGGATVAGLAALTKRTVASADALAKTADKIGISTGALQELRFAASQTGVEQNKLEMALQRMTRRLSEAAQGTGEAKNAIAELGLDAQELAAASPDKAFRMIADAMETVPNQADRVRLAFKFFDSEGVALVNTLRGGSEQLDAFSAQARNLGLVLEDDLLRSAEAANDQLDIMNRVLAAQTSGLLLDLAPLITEAGNAFARAIPQIVGFWDALRDDPATLDGIVKRLGSLKDDRSGILGQLAGGSGRGKLTPRVRARLRAQLEELNAEIKRLETKVAQRSGQVIFPGQNPVVRGAAGGLPATTGQTSLASATKQTTAAVREQTTAAQHLVERLREEAATLGMTEDQLLRYEAAQAVAAAGGAEHAAEIAQLVEQIILERAALEEVTEAAETQAETFKETTDEMTVFAEQAARNIQDAFANFLFDPFNSDLDGMLNNFVNTLRRMGAEILAEKLAEKFGLGGALTGGGGGGGGFDLGEIVRGASLAWGGITSFFGFADGGVMTAGGPMPLRTYSRGGVANSPQMAVFGEGSQNEAFVPLPDGRRIPVAMQGGGRGVTINVNTPNAESFRQARSKIAADVSRSLRA